MYMISHKSEIEMNNGRFGLLTPKSDKEVVISFYSELKGDETFAGKEIYDEQEQRRISHGLFAFDRKTFELEQIKTTASRTV